MIVLPVLTRRIASVGSGKAKATALLHRDGVKTQSRFRLIGYVNGGISGFTLGFLQDFSLSFNGQLSFAILLSSNLVKPTFHALGNYIQKLYARNFAAFKCGSNTLLPLERHYSRRLDEIAKLYNMLRLQRPA